MKTALMYIVGVMIVGFLALAVIKSCHAGYTINRIGDTTIVNDNETGRSTVCNRIGDMTVCN